MKTTLDLMKPGEKGKIFLMGLSGKVARRIMEMGLVKGAEVEIERFAPLGDPIWLIVKGYSLSLRKREARLIEVEK